MWKHNIIWSYMNKPNYKGTQQKQRLFLEPDFFSFLLAIDQYSALHRDIANDSTSAKQA